MGAHRILPAQAWQEEVDAARQPDNQDEDGEAFDDVAEAHGLLDGLDPGVDQVPGQMPTRPIDIRVVLRRPALPIARVHADPVVELRHDDVGNVWQSDVHRLLVEIYQLSLVSWAGDRHIVDDMAVTS